MSARQPDKARRTARPKKPDRWVRPFLKRYRSLLALALALGVLTAVFASALMFTSGYLISKAAETQGNIMLIFLPVGLVRIFGVGKPILQYVERLVSHDWVLRMTSAMRLKLYRILEKEAVFIKSRYRTGDILGLLVEDIGHLQNLYLRSIFPLVLGWLCYVLVVVGLGAFSVSFALVMLLLLGVVVLVVPLISVLVNAARQERRKALRGQLYQDLTDNVLGVADWVFSGRSGDYINGYRKAADALRSVDSAMNRLARRRTLAIHVLFGIAVLCLLIWAGGYFGGSYGAASNWIAAFVLGFFPLIDVFAPLSQAADEGVAYRDSVDRLGELPDAQEQGEAEAPRPNTSTPLAINIDGLSFRYPEAPRTALQDLTLSIAPGEKLALLGRSGSGKSTLLTLIRGDLSPQAGSVTLGGIATAQFGDEIANYLGVIQQQTYLFNATLAHNLTLGRPHISKEKLWEVLEQVGLRELAERLPNGLETMVDEAGLRFSGGERHRLALARVLVRDTPIVLLDEPMVGLDPLTEQALLETFLKALANKTVIMVTHHLQGVAAMDRVVFIEDGSIAMDGHPKELARQNAWYRQLLAFDRGLGV
jgi:ATP-binding cassette subfamily C protein CydC